LVIGISAPSIFNNKVFIRASPREYCSREDVELLIKIVADKIRRSRTKKHDSILALTNGGIIPARLMARELNVKHIQFIPVRNKKLHEYEMPPLFIDKKYLIVDEIYDTGEIFSKVSDATRIFDCDFAFLMSRYKKNNSAKITYVGKILNNNKWIVFPWE
jgi:hypoxanthine phosphoribosyltransferase